jgi:NitT/TauT family transport system substrate-binding protein
LTQIATEIKVKAKSALLKSLYLLIAFMLISTQSSVSQPLTTIRVAGPPNEGFKDVFYGVQAGIFAKYGLDVQPRITNGGAVVLAGLAGGSYDVAYTNLVPVLQAHVRGLPFQIIAPSTVFISDRSQNAMIVAKDSPLRTARDLNGKVIGTQSLQDLNSVAMRAWIDKNGGDSTTLHVLEVPSAAAVQALISHRIDAMALSEPILTEAIDTGKVRVFAKPQSAIADRFQAQAFVASSDYVAQHGEAMERFAKAMHESAVYNNAHLKQTIPLVSSFSSVPANVIARTVRSVDAEYVVAQSIQPLINFAAKYGLIPHDFPAEEIISPAAMKSPK